MPRRSKLTRGFTLIEAVIVIAIMAILASAATPLLMRSLTQQRTQKTRDMVRTAYEALVGARDRSVPNLTTDVGFVPTAAFNDLRILTTRNPAGGWPTGGVPPVYPAAAAGFFWGWNGPYWSTPIQSQAGTNGLPADAWGRPFRWAANQVQSAGADGAFGTADDVIYPPVALAAAAQVQVTVERQLPPPSGPLPPAVAFTVQVSDRNQQAIRTRIAGAFNFVGSGTGTTPPLAVQPGPVYLLVTTAVGNQSQTITLAPGESRVVLFRFNL